MLLDRATKLSDLPRPRKPSDKLEADLIRAEFEAMCWAGENGLGPWDLEDEL